MDDYDLSPHCFLNSILTTFGLINDNLLSHEDIDTRAVSSLSLFLNFSLHPSSPVVQLVVVYVIRFREFLSFPAGTGVAFSTYVFPYSGHMLTSLSVTGSDMLTSLSVTGGHMLTSLGVTGGDMSQW